ncbi:MAG: DNA repair protein RadC [Gammaproteobacteria bacterium]|nr:DNA repair protein RadC [Gammaproteobacteria bacterium]
MPISNWPEQERPRVKLLSKGPAALSDAELLAIFLRTGMRGKTALDLSRDLLTDYNGLRGLIETDSKTFCQTKGLGLAKYSQIQAAIELGKRYLQENLLKKDVLSSPNDTKNFLLAQLRAYPYEVFACLFLDNRHQIISFDKMFNGTIDGASVYPREVVKQALARNAAAVIFAHNHPSGVAEPSLADKNITRRLQEALGLVDIRVLDHFVIGENTAVSFAEQGLI